ncbi:MAG: DUF3048 domain-containing protein, partial [Clostridia bacterium]|nr:DUF3048 domain-containing protein [Clostridia bacterium]
MKKTLKIIITLMLTAVTLTLCSCDAVNDISGIIKKYTQTTEAPAAETTGKQTEEETEETPLSGKYRDPLTGELIDDDLSGMRPAAVVIKNDRLAAPQYGLSEAGILYEAAVEGGMTRFLAVYPGVSSLDNVGPVIDSRTYFYDFASNHDAMIVIAGSTAAGRELAEKRNITALDAIVGELEPGFERNAQLISERGSENSILAKGSGLKFRAQALGVEIRTDKSPVPYTIIDSMENREMPDGKHCSKLSIQFSANMNVYFTFSTLTNTYSRFQYGDKHIDAKTGKQLSFANLLVIFADQNTLNPATGEISISASGKGTGYYVYGGSYIPISWTRTGGEYPIKLYEADGKTPLTVSAGRTYIAVMSSSQRGKV